MSAQSEAIATLLAADATLLTSLTGGVFEFGAIGKDGVSILSIPTAYTDGYLKPIAVVKARSETRLPNIYDHAERYRGVRDMIEIYLMTDGDKSFTPLNIASERIEFLLEGQFVASGWAKIVNRIEQQREELLQNAGWIRLDVELTRGKHLI